MWHHIPEDLKSCQHCCENLRPHFRTYVLLLDIKCFVQLNFFNLTSYNLEILIIRHLWREIPRPGVLLFTRKKSSSVTHVDITDIFKLTKVSVRQLLWYLESPCLLRQLLHYEDSRKHRRGPWWHWTIRWRLYPSGIVLWLYWTTQVYYIRTYSTYIHTYIYTHMYLELPTHVPSTQYTLTLSRTA